jgi:predicted alpha/beta hydrolase family esterase
LKTEYTIAFLPGIGNSEYEHWQSRWHRSLPGSLWVEQQDWEHPIRNDWVAATLVAFERATLPIVVVAHSLGCLLAAEVLGQAPLRAGPDVIGAFLVAVPDAEGANFPPTVQGFRRALDVGMSVPSTVISSANDPFGSLQHARKVAERWGSEFIDVGALGHINLQSKLGDWPDGREHFERFIRSLPIEKRCVTPRPSP